MRQQGTFCTAIIESILTSCITVWYREQHCCGPHNALQRAVRAAERIVHTLFSLLPSWQE
ncbi:hypothetical protein L3Q82_026763, partial [Scortum barcoo]